LTGTQPNTAHSAAQPKIAPGDIHTKWDKITSQEAGNVKNTEELIAMVRAKYSLNQDQAQTDVNAWVSGRGFN